MILFLISRRIKLEWKYLKVIILTNQSLIIIFLIISNLNKRNDSNDNFS